MNDQMIYNMQIKQNCKKYTFLQSVLPLFFRGQHYLTIFV